jgi:hypothetical protein
LHCQTFVHWGLANCWTLWQTAKVMMHGDEGIGVDGLKELAVCAKLEIGERA